MQNYQPQNIAAVFIYNNSCLGICIFRQQYFSINCAKLQHLCYLDQPLIRQALSQCHQILTNQPKNMIFEQLTKEPKQFKKLSNQKRSKQLFHQILNQNVIKLTNIDVNLMMMIQDSYSKFEALCMLLQYLLKQTNLLKKQKFYFQDINYWQDYIFNHVQMNQNDIKFLQISNNMSHPSLLLRQRPSDSYQGVSILKYFQKRLRIKASRKYLKRLLFNPTYNKKQLQDRQNTISWIHKYINDYHLFDKLFKNIFSLDSIMQRFQKGKVEQQDWRKLIKSLKNIMEIRRCLAFQKLPDIVKVFVDDQNCWEIISKILKLIDYTIEIEPDVYVKSNYPDELYILRNQYRYLPKILQKIANQIKSYPIRCQIIFIQQQGYFFAVNHNTQFPNNFFQEYQWQQQFSTNSHRLFSCQYTCQLNQTYGDMQTRIKDLQIQTLFDLQTQISEYSQIITQIYWYVSRIQCYLNIANICKNMTRPRLSNEQLIIINGWNMMLGQKAVDNNSFMFNHANGPYKKVFDSQSNIVNTNYSNRISIISGPNGAGKTIYMKQVGIITYLAHCGLFVPATLAEIPLIDRIVVVQNSSSGYSQTIGFEKQLESLSKIMNKSILTNKSLILIDEIGLSCDYTIALKTLYSCVKYLSKNPNQFKSNRVLSSSSDFFKTPLTIIITHLTMLMTSNIIQQNYYVRFLTLDINHNFDYLYKIKPGLVQQGYGIKTAHGYIKDQKLLQNANKYWEKIKNKENYQLQ